LTTVCGTGGDIRFCGQEQTLIHINFAPTEKENQTKTPKKIHSAKIKTHKVLFHIVMAKFPIPENCSVYVPMILKEFCSSKFNGLVMKNVFMEIVTL
jgi:hypothetical protein